MTVSLVPTKAGELPAGFSSLGYPSFGPALASLAVQEFSEVHEWAFRSLAKAYVLSNGGIEWSQNPPKRLFLLLAPTATAGTRERNPTRTFRLSSYAFTPFDETLAADPVMVDDPARQEGLRKVAVDMWGWHPAYVGLLPVMFVIDGLNICFSRYIPQFRPVRPQIPMPLLADDDGKKAGLGTSSCSPAAASMRAFPFERWTRTRTSLARRA